MFRWFLWCPLVVTWPMMPWPVTGLSLNMPAANAHHALAGDDSGSWSGFSLLWLLCSADKDWMNCYSLYSQSPPQDVNVRESTPHASACQDFYI